MFFNNIYSYIINIGIITIINNNGYIIGIGYIGIVQKIVDIANLIYKIVIFFLNSKTIQVRNLDK